MKQIVILAALVLMVALPAVVSAQATGIVYVDLQRVMMESEKGKEAKRLLTEEANKVKKNLDAKQEELQRMKDGLEKQAATITPDVRAEKERQYQAKMKDYQRIYQDAQTELQGKDMEFTQKILKELEEVVRNLATREKYLLVLEKSQGGILYGSPTLDVTTKLITSFNELAKQKGK
jgi:outer membrane protein